MYKFKSFLSLMGLFLSVLASAQSPVKLVGVISDQSGQSLPSANIIAFNIETNKMESYGITNTEGSYKLALKTNTSYRIRTSFIGYKADTLQITIPNESVDITQHIVLSELTNDLGEIVLATDIPIVIKGDSIVYHAEDFENGTEQKLGDILKKLPGVEVNDDGEIEVEGKAVQKVMVEGKDFFDGDSKLAVENIPSDAVEKIEVLKNFSEVNQLKNVSNNQDNIALNIKLKAGKKNFWFGDITAGFGGNDRYLVHPKLFYYSPKKSINIITDVNNIGQIPFTRRDYFKFSGGFKNMSSSTGTSLNLTSDNLGFSLLKNNKAKAIDTKFGAMNFDYQIKDNLDLSGFVIYSGTENTLQEYKSTNYINNGIREDSEKDVVQDNKLTLGKLSLAYKPNPRLEFNYDVFGKLSKQTEHVVLTSNFESINNIIDEVKEDNPYSIQQYANFYYTLKNEDILSAQIQHYWAKENPFYSSTFQDVENPENDLPFYNVFPYQLDQMNYGLNQDKTVKTNKVDAKVDYYYILSKTSNITFTGGQLYTTQDYNTGIFQTLDNDSEIDFVNSTFNNHVNYRFSDSYLGGSYRILKGKFIINPGLTVHHYSLEDKQLGEKQTKSQTLLSPQLFVNYSIKKSETLRLTYSRVAQYADVYAFAQGYVLNNYNSLYQGNRNIENGLYDTWQLSYNSFSFYNGTNVNANITYINKQDPIKNSLTFNGINAVSMPINSSVTDESISTFGRIDKSFGKFKLRLNSRLSINNNYNVLDDQVTKSKSITQRHQASIQTTFDKGPNFEVGYQHLVDDIENNRSTNRFTTNRPFVKLESTLLKHLTLKADYSFYNYSDEDRSLNTYQFLNADLYYQKGDSPWEYRLGVSNILNTNSINNSSFADNYSTTTEYVVQPRYWIVTLKYNL